jgi:hypothetical protein
MPVTIPDITDALNARIAQLQAANKARMDSNKHCNICGNDTKVYVDGRYRCYSNMCTAIHSIVEVMYAARGLNG